MNNHDRSISVSLILDFCDMAEAPARSAEDELRFEFDFRSKLAELQRKYKEKQRELSQLRESNRTFCLPLSCAETGTANDIQHESPRSPSPLLLSTIQNHVPIHNQVNTSFLSMISVD